MLATLERPIEGSSKPARTWSTSGVAELAPPVRLRLLAPAPVEPAPLPRAVSLVLPAVRKPRSTGALRLTLRARRLLAALVLVCAVAVGVVAVDLLSAVVPFTPASSYAAQQAPYLGTGSGGSAGDLVPASGESVTVAAGDTLWSLAERVDPAADPRDVIAAIMTLNDLQSATVQPGQVLRLP